MNSIRAGVYVNIEDALDPFRRQCKYKQIDLPIDKIGTFCGVLWKHLHAGEKETKYIKAKKKKNAHAMQPPWKQKKKPTPRL
jgi:hypothetical protein